MPLLLHGAEIILVLDPDPAPRTQRRLALAPLARLNLKQKVFSEQCANRGQKFKILNSSMNETTKLIIPWNFVDPR